MTNMTKRGLQVTGAAAVFLAAAACGSGSTSGGGAPSTFQFGAMIPLSGTDSAVGTEAQRGIKMAIASVKKGDVLPKTKLEPIYRDNPGTPETAVTNFQKLESINGVPFSFTTFSSATVAIAPLATRNKVVLMNPGATTDQFKGLSPYLFSDIPLGGAQSKAMLDYAYNHLHIKRLAGVYSNDAQGDAFKKTIPGYWRSLGGTYVGDQTVSTSDTDFGPVLTKVKSEQPDAVYMGFFGSGQGDLIKQGAQMNFQPTWLGSTSFANQGALQIAGDHANGVYSTQVEPASNAEAQKFLADYKSKYGAAPTSFAQLSYSGTQVLAQALHTVIGKHQDISGENLKAAILADTFHTINGTMKFHSDGTVEVPITLTVYQNGQFKALGISSHGSFTPAGS